MKPGATPRGRRPQRFPLGALFASALFALILVGCGISLSAEPGGTEIFTRLTIEGTFTTDSRLWLSLRYTQPYPVPITIDCDLLAEKEKKSATPESALAATNTPTNEPTPTLVAILGTKPRPAIKVLDILVEELPANSEGGPIGEATPVPGVIRHRFVAPERPGSYVVECFTPEDENNFILFPLTIAPAPTPTATP